MTNEVAKPSGGVVNRVLGTVETVGNKLPDPAVLFFGLMVLIWLLSWPLSTMDFGAVHPVSGDAIVVANQVRGDAIANLLSTMVSTFVNFAPLGVVLVAMLGIGVAEETGLIRAALRMMLAKTPRLLLTPILIAVGIASHYAVDAGYVLVIPIGGVIFYAAGRHPLAGIMAAFAGVAGGFSANFWVPSALDPLLQGFTQSAAQLIDPSAQVSILCNNIFTAFSTILVVLVCWFITDRIIEPRLANTEVDGNPDEMPSMDEVTPAERRGLFAALGVLALCVVGLVAWLWPESSALRLDGEIVNFHAPIMKSIVPLILILSVVPSIVFGYVSGSVKTSKDIINGMSRTMNSMGYYLVLAFFCSLFIWMFGQSNLGMLLAIKGADLLKALSLPGPVTIVGVVLLVGVVNLFVGSASAKWGLISPVIVPMLMQIGISPDLTQAAYRVGDSATNIITPLNPYFPLVVVFCARYVTKTGIGTVMSLMLPYSLALFMLWSALLVAFWVLGIPLGSLSTYTYP